MKMSLVFHSRAIATYDSSGEKLGHKFMEASQNEDISSIAFVENS